MKFKNYYPALLWASLVIVSLIGSVVAIWYQDQNAKEDSDYYNGWLTSYSLTPEKSVGTLVDTTGISKVVELSKCTDAPYSIMINMDGPILILNGVITTHDVSCEFKEVK